jgi:hypothetical protein
MPSPNDHLSDAVAYFNSDHMHIVVTDPGTGHLLDFELIPLPLTVSSTLQALHDLRVRHLRRQDAAARDIEHLPTDNELDAHRVPDDGAVVEFDPDDVDRSEPLAVDGGEASAFAEEEVPILAPEDRAVVERRRRAEMIKRLRPLMHLYTNVSPYRPQGERRCSVRKRGGRS